MRLEAGTYLSASDMFYGHRKTCISVKLTCKWRPGCLATAKQTSPPKEPAVRKCKIPIFKQNITAPECTAHKWIHNVKNNKVIYFHLSNNSGSGFVSTIPQRMKPEQDPAFLLQR